MADEEWNETYVAYSLQEKEEQDLITDAEHIHNIEKEQLIAEFLEDLKRFEDDYYELKEKWEKRKDGK